MHRPDRTEQLRPARWALGAVGMLLLATGVFVSGGWPFLILGFLAVVGASTMR